jgi:hypothetical protein
LYFFYTFKQKNFVVCQKKQRTKTGTMK